MYKRMNYPAAYKQPCQNMNSCRGHIQGPKHKTQYVKQNWQFKLIAQVIVDLNDVLRPGIAVQRPSVFIHFTRRYCF